LGASLERLDPDIVCWWSMGGMSLSLIERVRRAGLPAVGFVHDDWLVYGPHVDAWLRLWRRTARGPIAAVAGRALDIPVTVDLSGAGLWAFVSEHTRRRALRELSLAQTTVLPSGIDARFLDPQPLQPWRWRLLYVGRVDERKGVRTAVQALAHLPPDAQLTVAGTGDLSLLDGPPGRVTHLGALDVEGLRAAYAAADVVLFPVTWHEPWGLVPLEAMGMGRPVVATLQGGAAEYLRDGVNCALCEPDDPESLAAVVRRLSASPELRGALRDGGAATAAAHTAPAFNRAVEDLLMAAPAQSSTSRR
jgi:glycosyltransferase involved in cell wall biosynthesis